MNKRTPSYVYTMFKDNQSEGESSIKVTHWLGNLAVHKYVHMVQTIDVTLVTFALNLKTDPQLVIHLCSHYWNVNNFSSQQWLEVAINL